MCFQNCAELSGNITIPEGMENIDLDEFVNCPGLVSILFKGLFDPLFQRYAFPEYEKLICYVSCNYRSSIFCEIKIKRMTCEEFRYPSKKNKALHLLIRRIAFLHFIIA